MDIRQTPVRESVPVNEYVRGEFVPLSHLAHDWELHSAVTLSPAEERTMVREPAQAVPETMAKRLGKLRVLVVPFLACTEPGDLVSFSKPKEQAHTSVWVDSPERTDLLLACRELDPHDTGFEFLASIAELLRLKLTNEELDRFSRLLEGELREEASGEIDEESFTAKQLLGSRAGRRNRSHFDHYRDLALVATLSEYMHGLWHDVQVRRGPEHLPVSQLRRRMILMAEMFPPNPGYRVFAQELENTE